MAKKKSLRGRLDATMKTINTPTFRRGFSKIDLWCSSCNYAMNRLWSGRFDRSFLFGRNYVFYGESGSGKSLMCAIAAADAQKQHGAMVIWLDVEHATDDDAGQDWLRRAGMNIDDPELFDYISVATLEEIKTVIMETSLAQAAMIKDGDEPQPVVIVVDSWAAALTASQADRVSGKDAGKLVGDMGQKARQTGDVILATTHACAGKPMMVLGVQHVMDNQDGYGRKHKTTGGHKMVYMASGCLILSKKELKNEDAEDASIMERVEERESKMSAEVKKKKSQFVGITATMEILKSRVGKPFEKVEIQIPWETGLDPYSGLFALMQQEGVVTVPSSGWYQYTNTDGEVVKFRKKEFRKHADAIMAAADTDISSAKAVQKEDNPGLIEEDSEDQVENEEQVNDDGE